jgi:hypothetical protein
MASEVPVITQWEAIVAGFTFFSPNILAFIQQPSWPVWLRRTTFALFHLVTAVVYLGAAGKFNGVNLSVAFSLIFTYGLASYIGLWKPIADKLEVKTSDITNSALRKLGVRRPLSSVTPKMTQRTADVMSNSVVGE